MAAAAPLLAACGASSSSQFLTDPPAALPPPIVAPLVAHDSRKSWLAPDIGKSGQLLFVSDGGTYDVDIFTLPDLKLAGRLTGFKFPTGECSDRHGDVWIANYLKHEMLEYSHEGKRLNAIVLAHLNPYGCAVNPTDGALAVTDAEQSNYGPGEVLVYAKPSARPIILRNPEQEYYLYPAYDSHGDLWVTGFSATEYPLISSCGASSCRTVVLRGGSIFNPGGIAWDNGKRKWIVFDGYCHESGATCSYPVSMDGRVGSPTTYLTSVGGQPCAVFQPAMATIGNQTIVAASDNEYACLGYKYSSVDLWSYSFGGTPLRYRSGVIYPWGAAVSAK